MTFGLEFIKKLKPCKWKYKAPLNDGKEHLGFIAQEIDEIVDRNNYGFVGMKDGFLTIHYMEFIAPLTKAIQELSEKVEKLEKSEVKEK